MSRIRKRETKVERSCASMRDMWMQRPILNATQSWSGAMHQCAQWMSEEKYAVWRCSVHTPRRLQWIVIGCKRNLQQRQKTLYKKILSLHILRSSPYIKIGCAPVRRTWQLFKSSCWSLSMQVIKFASATGFPVLVPPLLLDTLWSILLKRKFELIVRVSLHDGGPPRWFGLCTGT